MYFQILATMSKTSEIFCAQYFVRVFVKHQYSDMFWYTIC